jgi:hypothetical protein
MPKSYIVDPANFKSREDLIKVVSDFLKLNKLEKLIMTGTRIGSSSAPTKANPFYRTSSFCFSPDSFKDFEEMDDEYKLVCLAIKVKKEKKE